jgi:hypothetical protein
MTLFHVTVERTTVATYVVNTTDARQAQLLALAGSEHAARTSWEMSEPTSKVARLSVEDLTDDV